MSTSLFRSGTSFTEPRPRGAAAFLWPVTASGRLGHTVPAVTFGKKRIGFWIEYPVTVPLAAAAASSGLSAAGDEQSYEVSSDEVTDIDQAIDEADEVPEAPASAGLPVCEGAACGGDFDVLAF